MSVGLCLITIPSVYKTKRKTFVDTRKTVVNVNSTNGENMRTSSASSLSLVFKKAPDGLCRTFRPCQELRRASPVDTGRDEE